MAKTRVVDFPLGRVVATPGALAAIEKAGEHPLAFLMRHEAGDWGDLDAGDKQSNEEALANGDRILSAYNLKDGERIWILTESDRSVSTILLPSEY